MTKIYMKRCSTSLIMKCRSKLQRDIILHLLKLSTYVLKRTKSIGKHTENLALLYSIVGNINGITSIESNMTFSQIIKDDIDI